MSGSQENRVAVAGALHSFYIAVFSIHRQHAEATAVRPPLSPTHHRVLSDSTIAEEPKNDSFRDALNTLASPLPYEPTSAFTVNSKQAYVNDGEKLRREESPVAEGSKSGPPTWWDKIVLLYDLWYHRLKMNWPVFVAVLLTGIVCCSIAIGWSFRLKTFNIADADSTHDSIVSSRRPPWIAET